MQQLAAQIPWFHNCVLLEKVKDLEARQWYIQKTVEHGWSRNVLTMQIETDLYQRQGSAVTNFERTLPKPQSDLARQMLKDPYSFEVRHHTWIASLFQTGVVQANVQRSAIRVQAKPETT